MIAISRPTRSAYVLLGALCLIASPFAADKKVQGTVKGVDNDSLVVTTATGTDMLFTVDARTLIVDKDGKAKTTKPHTVELFDLLKTGDAVDVGFYDLGGTMHASQVHRISFETTTLPSGAPPPPAPPIAPQQPAPAPAPPAVVAPENTLAMIPVFYATDRVRTSYDPLSYGSMGEASERLHLGRFDVSIPRDHNMGDVERPTLWTFWKQDPAKHLTFVNRTEMTYAGFYGDITSVLSKTTSRDKEVFVFIHGFNVAFEDAIYQTAQMAYDLGFDGAPILYSWPSRAALSDYRIDEKNNEWTIDHLQWFLEDVRAKSGADVVHLVAHSMGNRPLIRVLDAMVARMPQTTGARPRFGEIVMTAPDVEVRVFTQIVRRITNLGRRLTLYASGKDKALEAAHRYDTFQRAGDTNPRIVILRGVDTVDATAVQTGFVNHSYFRENRSVISDVFYVMQGLAASARFAIKPAGTPPDYYIFKQ